MFDWQALVIILVVGTVWLTLCEQYHFAGLLALIGISLGGMELFSKLQTGHTISQHFSAWAVDNEWQAWVFTIILMSFTYYLIIHLMERKRK